MFLSLRAKINLIRKPFNGGVEYFSDDEGFEDKLSKAHYPTTETEKSAQHTPNFYIEFDDFHIWD
jgi:hypothetical protein